MRRRQSVWNSLQLLWLRVQPLWLLLSRLGNHQTNIVNASAILVLWRSAKTHTIYNTCCVCTMMLNISYSCCVLARQYVFTDQGQDNDIKVKFLELDNHQWILFLFLKISEILPQAGKIKEISCIESHSGNPGHRQDVRASRERVCFGAKRSWAWEEQSALRPTCVHQTRVQVLGSIPNNKYLLDFKSSPSDSPYE